MGSFQFSRPAIVNFSFLFLPLNARVRENRSEERAVALHKDVGLTSPLLLTSSYLEIWEEGGGLPELSNENTFRYYNSKRQAGHRVDNSQWTVPLRLATHDLSICSIAAAEVQHATADMYDMVL